MKCPVCKDVTLLMSEKKGIEIDYCPECRGIWLDRGELEKLLAAEEKVANRKEEKEIETKQTPRKKESFLSEIFELFGD